MESKTIRINPNKKDGKKFPYFAKDSAGNLWLVTSKNSSRKTCVNCRFVEGNRNLRPFEYKTLIYTRELKPCERLRINMIIEAV